MSYGLELYDASGGLSYSSEKYPLMWVADIVVTVPATSSRTQDVSLPGVSPSENYGFMMSDENGYGLNVGVQFFNGFLRFVNKGSETAVVRVTVFNNFK